MKPVSTKHHQRIVIWIFCRLTRFGFSFEPLSESILATWSRFGSARNNRLRNLPHPFISPVLVPSELQVQDLIKPRSMDWSVQIEELAFAAAETSACH